MKRRVLSIVLASTMTIGCSSLGMAETQETGVETNKPYINGYDDGTFKPQKVVSRTEMAKMITVLKELEKSITNFPDIELGYEWAKEFIGAAEKVGILVGDDHGKFRPRDGLTRAEMATIVSRIVALGDEPRDKIDGVKFSDIDGHWGKDAIVEISNLGIINGYEDGTFRPNKHVTRQEAVKMLSVMMGRIPDPLIDVKLNNPYSDIVNEWGFKYIFAAGTDYKYKLTSDEVDDIIVGEAEENFQVVEGTFSEDKEGQVIGVMLNGRVVSIDALKAAGYSLEFETYIGNIGNESANQQVFGSENASTTGVIGEHTNGKSTIGKYSVVLTLKKDDQTFTSKRATINIVDLSTEVSSIESIILTNDSGKGEQDGPYAFEQVSNIMVVGEKLKIDEVIAIVNGKEVTLGDSSVSIESSNDAIEIEGTSPDRRIVAKRVGDAKVTITAGKATKVYDLKVVEEARVETKVEAFNKTNGMIVGKESSAKVKVTDQYGDPIRVFSDSTRAVYSAEVELSSSSSIETGAIEKLSTQLGTVDKKGVGSLNLGSAAKEGQTGTIVIRRGSETILGEIFVKTESTELISKKLVVSADSDKQSPILEVNSNDSITYVIEEYNENGTLLGVADLTGYKFSSIKDSSGASVLTTSFDNAEASIDSKDVVINSGTEEISAITFKGDIVKTSHPVKVYDRENTEIGTIDFEITEAAYALKGIVWKDVESILSDTDTKKVIDLETLVGLEKSNTPGEDPLIEGLIVSGEDTAPKRVTFNKEKSSGDSQIRVMDIYLDKDNDGVFSDGDKVIGRIELTTDAEGVNLLGTTENPEFGAEIVKKFSEGVVTYKLVAVDGTVLSTKNITIDANLEKYINAVDEKVHELRGHIYEQLSTGYLSDTIALGIENGSSSVLNETEETFIKPKSAWNTENGTEGEGKLGKDLYTEIRALKEKLDPVNNKDLYNKVLAIEERLIQADNQVHEAYRISELAKYRLNTSDDRSTHDQGERHNRITMDTVLAADFVANVNETLVASVNREPVGREKYYGPGKETFPTLRALNDEAEINASNAKSTLDATMANRVYDASNLEMVFPFSVHTVKKYNLKGSVTWADLGNAMTVNNNNGTAVVMDKPIYGEQDKKGALSAKIDITNTMGTIYEKGSGGTYTPIEEQKESFDYELRTSIKRAGDLSVNVKNHVNNGDVVTSLADRVFYGKGRSANANKIKAYYTLGLGYGNNYRSNIHDYQTFIQEIKDSTGGIYYFNITDNGIIASGVTIINGRTPGADRLMTYDKVSGKPARSIWGSRIGRMVNIGVATYYDCDLKLYDTPTTTKPCLQKHRVPAAPEFEYKEIEMATTVGNISALRFNDEIGDAEKPVIMENHAEAVMDENGNFSHFISVSSEHNFKKSAPSIANDYAVKAGEMKTFERKEFANDGNEAVDEGIHQTKNLIEVTIEWK